MMEEWIVRTWVVVHFKQLPMGKQVRNGHTFVVGYRYKQFAWKILYKAVLSGKGV
jgi:hypothetical protein